MRPFSNSGLKRAVPLGVVVVTLFVVVASVMSNLNSGKQSFAFETYWPDPSAYTPGSNPPAAFLEINYTGPGQVVFSYLVTYNSTGGNVVVASGQAHLTQLAPFRLYLYIPTNQGETVMASAKVFSGGSITDSPIFSKSIAV